MQSSNDTILFDPACPVLRQAYVVRTSPPFISLLLVSQKLAHGQQCSHSRRSRRRGYTSSTLSGTQPTPRHEWSRPESGRCRARRARRNAHRPSVQIIATSEQGVLKRLCLPTNNTDSSKSNCHNHNHNHNRTHMYASTPACQRTSAAAASNRFQGKQVYG